MNTNQSPLRILVVDDDPISRALLEEHLTAAGHHVSCAESAEQAMYALERSAVHIVIADWIMPGVSGLDLCRWVRSRQWPLPLHFVMLTVLNEQDRLVEAFEAGVDDFLSKPFYEAELLARLRAWTRLVTMQEELALRHKEGARLTSELISANKKLADLASLDDLTGIGNRREAIRQIEEHLAVATRYDYPMSCGLLDVDHFKNINDSYGHAVGDRALKHIADLLKENSRRTDRVFRMGGDEFLVLLPNQNVQEAFKWAERCRSSLANTPFTHNSEPLELTVSIGLAERSAATPTLDGLLEAADTALYLAKEEGRNTTREASASNLPAGAEKAA